jgi:hypothetical protein
MNDLIWCFSCKEMKPTKLFEATRYLSRGFEQCCIKCNNELFKREAIKIRTEKANDDARKEKELRKLERFKKNEPLRELIKNDNVKSSPERLSFLKSVHNSAKAREYNKIRRSN